MVLCTVNNTFKYELENICRLFFPFEKITAFDTEQAAPKEEMWVAAYLAEKEGKAHLTVKFAAEGFAKESCDICDLTDTAECERRLAVLLFDILCEYTGLRPEWGILTGVRPAKLMRRLTETMGAQGAREYFAQKLLCTEQKIALCAAAADNEQKIIQSSRPDHFSLYFAIPFCPTRCSYCSFVSHSVEHSMGLMEEYVTLLCKELEVTGKIARELGLKLSTIYVGGGTPTTLSANQLEVLMDAVGRNFDIGSATEYTVEAGRPDTITADKLRAILKGGATRISINPQTLNDKVLEAIGRRHTAKEAIDAFNLARQCGMNNINMDLIAGLPEDNVDSFGRTLDGVLALDPESITVHTLSMKRSSRLTVGGELPDTAQAKAAGEMLNMTGRRLQPDYIPYYLYRQSKTVGNHENTGYAKAGYECLYNIFMMDETHTVLACGASGVTKLKKGENTIERIFNYKYPYEYNGNFDEILRRKEGIKPFYDDVKF